MLIPTPPAAWHDVRLVLEEEVNRLPRRYRSVFVLRFLRSLTDAEAGWELCLPTGTVLSRARVTCRGVTLTAGALAVGCADEASAGLPFSLVHSVVKTDLTGAADNTVAAGVVSAPAATLAKGAIPAQRLPVCGRCTSPLRASVGTTTTRNAVPPICRGHIDRGFL